jgi:hypothetical protein
LLWNISFDDKSQVTTAFSFQFLVLIHLSLIISIFTASLRVIFKSDRGQYEVSKGVLKGLAMVPAIREKKKPQ